MMTQLNADSVITLVIIKIKNGGHNGVKYQNTANINLI